MMGIGQSIIGMVFSEVDVRLVDCSFTAKGDYTVRQWAGIPRLEKSDIALSMDLKACLAEKGVLQKNVAMTLPDSDFLLKTTTLPKIARKDIQKYLDREIAKGLDLPVKECLYDFLVSNERDVFGVKKIDLTYLAAPRALILRYADIVMAAGLTPALIVPSSMAMFHLMTLEAPSVSGPDALIYLGANRTTITIAEGDHVVFTRRLNLSPFTPVLYDGSAQNGEVFDDAIREIKRTLLYCKKEVLSQEVVRVITASKIPLSDLQIDLIREKLNVEVLPWQLNKTVAEDVEDGETAEKMSEGYLFALGAGASAARGTRLQILPWSLKWKRYEARVLRLASILLLFFFLGGVWSYVVQKDLLAEITTLAVDMEMRLAASEAARKVEEARMAARSEMETRQAILSRFRRRRPDFQTLFQIFSRGMPGNARFDDVTLTREAGRWAVSLKGKTFGKESLDQVTIFASLAEELQASERFSNLILKPLKSHLEPSGGGMPFQIRTSLK